jgi:predicted acyltransferase (DUF342 family)
LVVVVTVFTKPLGDRGSAVVSVIGVLAVLAMVATGSVLATRENARMLQRRTDSVAAFYIAEACLAVGESFLLEAIREGEPWTKDTSLQGENAYVVPPPLESFAEMQSRLDDIQIFIDVIDACGIYKIRVSVSMAGAGSAMATTATASVSKLVAVSRCGGGDGGGPSPELIAALNKGIISDRNVVVDNNAYIRASVHANGTVTVGKNVIIALGHTSGADEIIPLPTIADIRAYAESQAESTRSEYSGGWTSDPRNLAGNVHLTEGLKLSNNQFVTANLWVEGDMQIGNNVVVVGDIFVEGDLTIGQNVLVHGKVFVRGNASLGNNAVIGGPIYVYGGPDECDTLVCNNVVIGDNIVAASDVEIRNNVVVKGSLLSGGSISFHNNAALGRVLYGALVYSAGDTTVKNDVVLSVAAMIAHGDIKIHSNAVINESLFGVDPSVLELFPGGSGSLIIDGHWGG